MKYRATSGVNNRVSEGVGETVETTHRVEAVSRVSIATIAGVTSDKRPEVVVVIKRCSCSVTRVRIRMRSAMKGPDPEF